MKKEQQIIEFSEKIRSFKSKLAQKLLGKKIYNPYFEQLLKAQVMSYEIIERNKALPVFAYGSSSQGNAPALVEEAKNIYQNKVNQGKLSLISCPDNAIVSQSLYRVNTSFEPFSWGGDIIQIIQVIVVMDIKIILDFIRDVIQ